MSITIVDEPGYGRPPEKKTTHYYTEMGVVEVLGVKASRVIDHLDSLGYGYGIGWHLHTQHGPMLFPESIIHYLRDSGVFDSKKTPPPP